MPSANFRLTGLELLRKSLGKPITSSLTATLACLAAAQAQQEVFESPALLAGPTSVLTVRPVTR